MANDLMIEAYKVEHIPMLVKAVFVALCDAQNHNTGNCFPGIKTLSRKVNASERSVKYATKYLIDNGFMTRKRRIGTSSQYFIKRPNEWPKFTKDNCPKIEYRPAKSSGAADCPSGNEENEKAIALADEQAIALAVGQQIAQKPAVKEPEENQPELSIPPLYSGIDKKDEAPPAIAVPPQGEASPGKSGSPAPKDAPCSSKISKPKKTTPLPENWELPPEWEQWVYGQYPNMTYPEVKLQADMFRDYALSTGKRYADWLATWRNWIRRSRSMYRGSVARSPIKSKSEKRKEWLDKLLGNNDNDRRIIDIN